MLKILREPLLHFLLLGAVLFLVYFYRCVAAKASKLLQQTSPVVMFCRRTILSFVEETHHFVTRARAFMFR